jgi:hypothetical protein
MRSSILPAFCNLTPFVALALCAGALLRQDQPAAALALAPASAKPAADLATPEGDYIRWLDDSGATLRIETAFDVVPHLDIKPGDCPNPLKIGPTDLNDMAVSKVPVSILGNAFDVTQVDLASVQLSSAGIPEQQGGQIAPYQFAYADTGTPFEGKECACHTLTADGALDLSMNFNRLQLIDVLELGQLPTGTDVQLRVTGTFLHGKGQFTIFDCVRISNAPE